MTTPDPVITDAPRRVIDWKLKTAIIKVLIQYRDSPLEVTADAILSLGLPAPAPAPVSSEGFVLVPVEPTEAMLRAAVSGWPTEVRRVLSSTWSLAANTYDAMIAAAPSPDQPSEEIEN